MQRQFAAIQLRVLGIALFAVALGAHSRPCTADPVYPPCNQSHPGRQHRAESVAKRGDARMTQSVAGHIVLYAIQRYGLTSLVNRADTDRASQATYEFLKWKLGNASAVATQFVGAGYQHFDKAYVDEAGAALMGFDLPKEKDGHSMFYLPPDLLKAWDVTERLGNAGRAYFLQYYYGIPAGQTKQVMDAIQDKKLGLVRHLGFSFPKQYDFPNGLLMTSIETRRSPAQAQQRIQRVLEEAAKQDGAKQ